MSRVSVIIPVYNAEVWLEPCLRSVTRQTHTDLEILIVDDGSSDDSAAIVSSVLDPRIRLLRQNNKGAASARNLGISEATGEFIQFLDADDLLEPDKIARQLHRLDFTLQDTVATCQWIRFSESPGDLGQSAEPQRMPDRPPLDWLIDSLSGGGMFQTACWLTPRVLIEKAGPWNESLTLHDDGEFFTRVLLRAAALRSIPEPLVYYRSVPSSLSRQRSLAAATSSLHVSRSRANEMLAVDRSLRVRCALATSFLQVAYEFSKTFPQIAKQALSEIESLSARPRPIVGGRFFRIATRLLGATIAVIIYSRLSSRPRGAVGHENG